MILHQKAQSSLGLQKDEIQKRSHTTPPDSPNEKANQGEYWNKRKVFGGMAPRPRRESSNHLGSLAELARSGKKLAVPAPPHQSAVQVAPAIVHIGHPEPSPNKKQLLDSIHRSLPPELRLKMEDELMECREDVLRVMEKWAKLQKHKEDTKLQIREQKRRIHNQDVMVDVERFIGNAPQGQETGPRAPATNVGTSNEQPRSPPPKKFGKLEKFMLLRHPAKQESSVDASPGGWTGSKHKQSEENTRTRWCVCRGSDFHASIGD